MKNSTPHAISIGYRIEAKPAYLSTRDVLNEMLQAIRFGAKFPQDLKITVTIRERSYDFSDLLRTGTTGLMKLIERRLVRDLEAL